MEMIELTGGPMDGHRMGYNRPPPTLLMPWQATGMPPGPSIDRYRTTRYWDTQAVVDGHRIYEVVSG